MGTKGLKRMRGWRGGGMSKRPYITHRGGGLRYGNGCIKWPDCFTCPFPECRAGLASFDFSGSGRKYAERQERRAARAKKVK